MPRKSKQLLYIIPGWGDRLSDPAYRELIKRAKEVGYCVKLLSTPKLDGRFILGSSRGFRECVERIVDQLERPYSLVTLLGFSIGATLAHEIASLVPIGRVILGSMRPYLSKDLLRYSRPEVLKILSPSQYLEMANIDYGKLRAKEAVVLYGDSEDRLVRQRSCAVAKENRAKRIEVKGADHFLDRDYMEVLSSTLV